MSILSKLELNIKPIENSIPNVSEFKHVDFITVIKVYYVEL